MKRYISFLSSTIVGLALVIAYNIGKWRGAEPAKEEPKEITAEYNWPQEQEVIWTDEFRTPPQGWDCKSKLWTPPGKWFNNWYHFCKISQPTAIKFTRGSTTSLRRMPSTHFCVSDVTDYGRKAKICDGVLYLEEPR